jgi:adenine-specific DNA-methyltransferase
MRYMGSKVRLLRWIEEVLSALPFESALDAFSGSGAVAHLLKAMGKTVAASDFLKFPYTIATATIENNHTTLTPEDVSSLVAFNRRRKHFIERTFSGIFFTQEDLRFLDNVWANLHTVEDPYKRAIAVSAMVRSCVKRQPRGVFTVSGDPERYKDGRRDLRLSLREHFLENVDIYNCAVFDNGRSNTAFRADVFAAPTDVDLVYMDPPYVPRSDDNCYVKRYHFLEGLASYWQDPDAVIQTGTKVRKIAKRYTPFSYRRTAVDAFDRMFKRFHASTLILSYSSNGYPELATLVDLMGRYKSEVSVHERAHRYHFGTHASVTTQRTSVREYLIVGTGP